MPELREHAGRHFAVQFLYALSADSWAVELSEAVPAPDTWADIPGSPEYLPGPAFLDAFVPDEDPSLEPTIHVHSHDEHVVPSTMPNAVTCVYTEVARGYLAECCRTVRISADPCSPVQIST